jgi:uncharacterized protein
MVSAAGTQTSSAAISQYVLKVHSRCDLACDHCYVYEHADQSWRIKPRVISAATAEMAAERIGEHAAKHLLPQVNVILHGGEPLLLGRDAMRGVLSVLAARITPVTRLDVRIHTNGVRLDERWCELFDEHAVRVGVSLDGDQAANDLHRLFADGRSSYGQVRQALALLRGPKFRHLYSGLLCTVDLANDPVAVYRALIAERPPRLDLLLPHATWDNPPSRPATSPHPYADWLLAVYRCWVKDGRPVPIRLFDSVLSASRGGPSWTEMIGLDPVGLLVIDTDGSWEQADSMKTAFDGAPATGMRIQAHSVDDVVRHPGIAARRGGLSTLCTACQTCRVVRICGGGLYAHRYQSGTEFSNPSVYCADLMEMIGQLTAKPPEVMMVRTEQRPSRPVHQLTDAALDALAAGPGDVAAVTTLSSARLSLTRALVAILGAATDQSTDQRRDHKLAIAAAEGWAVLCDVDAACPDAVADVFAHPYTHAWAVRCLNPPPGADTELDRAHLAGLAAAAALRAGISAVLPLPVRDGLVHLPSLGAFDARTSATRTVRVSVSAGRLTTGDGYAWRPVRRVAGSAVQVAVDDLDPFRDCQQWPATGRLSESEWLAWQRGLTAASRRLADRAPAYAQVLATGLRAVIPLYPTAEGTRSATARQAFGAVGVAFPADPREIDDLLVHEFQHTKLYGLCDLRELFDRADTQRLRIPWRPDPRPVEGVLHGAYAHLALAHLSRGRGEAGRTAWLRYQGWVRGACEALRGTRALTADGQRFVAGIEAAVEAGDEELR